MLVKDVILKVCDFIEEEELLSAIKSGELNEEQSKLRDKLVKYFNLVNDEIISQYMPIVKIEKRSSSDGKHSLEDFSEKVADIISVRDEKGNELEYKLIDNSLVTKRGNIFVFYNAFPKDLGIDDMLPSTLPERVFAYGVVREYYLIQSLYEDAEVWDGRFKDGLQLSLRKKGNTYLPMRRWI